jgi:hypothetical protein
MAEISVEENSTIIFPAQFMTTVQGAVSYSRKKQHQNGTRIYRRGSLKPAARRSCIRNNPVE